MACSTVLLSVIQSAVVASSSCTVVDDQIIWESFRVVVFVITHHCYVSFVVVVFSIRLGIRLLRVLVFKTCDILDNSHMPGFQYLKFITYSAEY
jgi:hypothetical protein